MTLPAILLKRLVLAFERYPLILFVGIGLTLFWLFPNEEESEVFFSQAERESVWVAHATQMGIPNLKAAEKGRVTKRLIDDEVLFREAKRLGLDKEDSIIKQRLIQKMLFIAEEEGGGSTPSSSQELVHYFEKHRKNWMLPRRRALNMLGRS